MLLDRTVHSTQLPVRMHLTGSGQVVGLAACDHFLGWKRVRGLESSVITRGLYGEDPLWPKGRR